MPDKPDALASHNCEVCGKPATRFFGTDNSAGCDDHPKGWGLDRSETHRGMPVGRNPRNRAGRPGYQEPKPQSKPLYVFECRCDGPLHVKSCPAYGRRDDLPYCAVECERNDPNGELCAPCKAVEYERVLTDGLRRQVQELQTKLLWWNQRFCCQVHAPQSIDQLKPDCEAYS